MSSKLRKFFSTENLIKIFWVLFFTFLVFFIDVKLARYKLIGVQLALLALMFLWFMRDYRAMGEIIKEAPFLPPLLLALFYSGAYLFSPASAGAYPEWQRVIFSIAAYIGAYRIFYSAGGNFLINYVIAAGGLISIYGLLQVTGGIGFIGVPKLGRIFATFGNPNFFASFLIGLLPLAAASFLTKKRLWKLAALFFMALALYYTKTRGAWLGITAALILWYIHYGRKKIPRYAAAAAVVIIVIGGFINRAELTRNTQRLLIWRDSIKMAADNPAAGVGIGNFHNEFPDYASPELLNILPQGKFIVNYAHNEFIDILTETGIAGLGLYLWLLALFLIINFKSSPRNYIQYGAFLGAFAIIVHSAFSVNMRFAIASIWAFFLMGLSLGDRSGNYRKLPELSVKGKRYKVFSAAAFLFLCGLGAKNTVTPLVSRKKLASEVGFFDSQREYSREELKSLIAAGTEDAQLYYKLGWIQAKDKKFSEAIKNFKKSIELDESLTGAYNNLGNIYYTLGKRNEAAKYYRRALERDPGMADAHFNLGYIYYYQGRLKEATREFNEVLRLEPNNYKAKMMLDKMVQ